MDVKKTSSILGNSKKVMKRPGTIDGGELSTGSGNEKEGEKVGKSVTLTSSVAFDTDLVKVDSSPAVHIR